MKRKFYVALGNLNADTQSINDKNILKHINFIGSINGLTFSNVYLKDKLMSIPIINEVATEIVEDDNIEFGNDSNYKAKVYNFYRLFVKIPKQNTNIKINSAVIIEKINNSYIYYSIFLFKPENINTHDFSLVLNLYNTGESIIDTSVENV